MKMPLRRLRVLLLALVAAGALQAQGIEYVKANYTKYEFQIPMRDGVRLFTSVYAPKDTSQPYPILMMRTPYSVGPYGADNYRRSLGPSEKLAKELYIFAFQDVRGRYKSEGEFVNMRPYVPNKGPKQTDESTDTYDTVEWLVRNIPNNNGRVGIWGISYPGFYAAIGAIDAHPALKACSPQAPLADWFVGDDWHHNGALFLAHTFNFLAGFGRPQPEPGTVAGPSFDHGTPDGYKFFLNLGPLSNANEKHFKDKIAFWNDLMQHGTYDEFWKSRNIRPHLRDIKPAMMTVGGWFDAEDAFGALAVYRSVESSSPGAVNILVEGPWSHGQWSRGKGDSLGTVKFHSNTSEFYQEKIEFPFFQYHLKGKGEPSLPEAYVFQTGTNQWLGLDAWPPKEASEATLYFHADGRLSFDPPPGDAVASFDEYVSDPAKPVPHLSSINIGMANDYMVDDQRFASRRTDVLAYQTEPLEEDLTVTGPVTARLHISTTGTDSDWVVKLIDVYPDNYPNPDPNPTRVRMGGYEQLVRGEPFRGKFRNSFEKPEPFEPGKVTKVEFVMPDVFHTFRRGHRVMVHVQSSWFPLVDRNPQKFVDIYSAKASDFQKATQRVYRSKAAPSAVKVNILK
jgi:putative CocE/NonD family hydrolase